MVDPCPGPGERTLKKLFCATALPKLEHPPQACTDWIWVMAENPAMPGIGTESRFWQSVWAGWLAIRPFLQLRLPQNRMELLSMPLAGIKGVWSKPANSFFSKDQNSGRAG